MPAVNFTFSPLLMAVENSLSSATEVNVVYSAKPIVGNNVSTMANAKIIANIFFFIFISSFVWMLHLSSGLYGHEPAHLHPCHWF